MNIFAKYRSPRRIVIDMIDKHIVKMPTETCQMLHTNELYFLYLKEYNVEPTLRQLKEFHSKIDSKLMKPAMLNHPSTIWARQSNHNAKWLYEHGIALCDEYTYRYGKVHGSESRIKDTVFHIQDGDWKQATPVFIAMADKYRLNREDYFQQYPLDTEWDFVIESYRHYYLEAKWSFASWKKREPPIWWGKDHIKNKLKEREEKYAFLKR
jgi:hypothetical protein|tara:strand:- start:4945 stop:5574 length:630 start_codon:yes stop_codon:yes gene_type:complete